MSKFLPCKNICPIVAEKNHEIACLKQEVSKLDARINILIAGRAEDEKRIARARQALFGVVDINIVGGP